MIPIKPQQPYPSQQYPQLRQQPQTQYQGPGPNAQIMNQPKDDGCCSFSFKFVFFSIFISLHAFLLGHNSEKIDINLVFTTVIYNRALVYVLIFFYGVFFSATIFYCSQAQLKEQLSQSRQNELNLRRILDAREGELARMRAAAANIVVPYRLDSLVDRGLTDFVDMSTNPNTLSARPVGSR